MSLVTLLIVAQLRLIALEPTPTIASPTRSASRVTPPLALAMIGMGGAAILAGALVGALGFIPATTELDVMCPGHRCNSPSRPLFDRAESLGVAANLTAGIGALYVVAGVAWWIAARFDRVPGTVRVAPVVLADGPGLLVIGRF